MSFCLKRMILVFKNIEKMVLAKPVTNTHLITYVATYIAMYGAIVGYKLYQVLYKISLKMYSKLYRTISSLLAILTKGNI